jgi:glycosyltransferase involved in cell wall biosynthesis
MRIGIDVRYLSHGLVGGVHTYIAQLVPILLELAAEHQIFLYADTKRPLEIAHIPSHVTVRRLPWRHALSTIYQDLTIRRWMAQDRLDLAHFPANYGFGPPGVSTAITVHDAINILPITEIVRGHPKSARTLAMMTYLHLCSSATIRRADLVLTVSRYSAGEIARLAGLTPSRIVPIPHAPTPDLARVTDPSVLADVRARLELPNSFVLADALKNPAVLVKAWRHLSVKARANRKIAFFSRRLDPLPVVAEAVGADDAVLLGRVTRADLIALYSLADAFVFPSWLEGFGIPILEAMMCGAPVIASDRGAIPEVAGDAALLVDAEDDSGLAAAMTAVLSKPELAANLREKGFTRAGHFSWRASAERTLAAYVRTVASTRRTAA